MHRTLIFLTLPFAWPGKGKKSGKARFQSCCLEETVISLCTLRLSHVVFFVVLPENASTQSLQKSSTRQIPWPFETFYGCREMGRKKKRRQSCWHCMHTQRQEVKAVDKECLQRRSKIHCSDVVKTHPNPQSLTYWTIAQWEVYCWHPQIHESQGRCCPFCLLVWV